MNIRCKSQGKWQTSMYQHVSHLIFAFVLVVFCYSNEGFCNASTTAALRVSNNRKKKNNIMNNKLLWTMNIITNKWKVFSQNNTEVHSKIRYNIQCAHYSFNLFISLFKGKFVVNSFQHFVLPGIDETRCNIRNAEEKKQQ